MRHIRNDRKDAQIRQSQENLRTYYANLMACGSVWACPVCAPKIQHVRANEVRVAIDYWIKLGGSVVMPTHTTQHDCSDRLSDLLKAFLNAMMKNSGQRAYTRLRKNYGIAHSIKALEITHGSNGWHPHAHTILFLEEKPDLEQLAKEMFPLWQNATARAGLKEPSEKAFTVVDASQVKTYITKMGTEYQWNVEHELTKSHSKAGKGSSFSPFDFLRANLDTSDPRLLGLFSEFAHTFHGRRQLVWSNGSKQALLGQEGLTDQQIADSLGKLDPVLAYISFEDWQRVREGNYQGDLLQVAERYGAKGVDCFLSNLD